MAVKLIALDIDGTVVRHDETTPRPEVIAAINDLSQLGVAVILASGRMFPGTHAVAELLDLDTPLICQQGCGIHRPDGSLLHRFPIARATALSLVDHAKATGHPYEWFDPGRYIVSAETPEALRYARLSGIEPELVDRPEDSDLEPTGVGIISNRIDAPKIHAALESKHGDELHVLDFPSVTVAVSDRASKGHSLSILCEDLGVDRKDVVAAGDSVNDASMLEWAGRGFAMANSDRYATDAADEILSDDPNALGTLLEALARKRRDELGD